MLGAIAAGGAIGAPLRYAVGQLVAPSAGGFPTGTLTVNVTGSFVLGLLLAVLLERFPPTRYARAFAGTGIVGAYTTFSTFAVETDSLVRDGQDLAAAGYIGASLVLGIAAVWAGLAAGRWVPALGANGR